MRKLIGYYVKSLSRASKSLSKKSLFIEKPWALVDNDNEIQKLIFKKDGELILSKNGQVEIGSWQYLAEARSLLIDRVRDKLLLQEQFIDENVLILRKDGTTNDFFALANENNLPDYDIPTYLNSLKQRRFNIKEELLLNGDIIEIYDGNSFGDDYKRLIGRKVDVKTKDEVLLNASGYYTSKCNQYIFQLENGYISHVMNRKNMKYFKTYDGQEIELEYFLYSGENEPRMVTINGNPVLESKILLEDKTKTLYIKDSFLIRVTSNTALQSNDGSEYEIENAVANAPFSWLNLTVTNNGKPIKDGSFWKGNLQFDVKGSRIIKIILRRDYKLSKGFTVTIEQKNPVFPDKGDKIVDFTPGSILPDGKYRVKGTLRWLRIKDMAIV